MLSDKQIKKFKEIYLKKFGRKISRKEACEQGIKLINLVKKVIEETKDNNNLKY